LVWFGVIGVLLWGFLATFSRTVIAAATVALAVPFGALLHEGTSKHWLNAPRLRLRARDLFMAVLAAALLFAGAFWPQVLARAGISSQEEAVQLRTFYNTAALSSGDGLLGVNWAGAGIGNFVTWLMHSNPHLPSWQYQPAHNLYLLVYTETGIFGLLTLGAFILLLVRALVRNRMREPLIRWGLLAAAAIVLFTAFFDHFYWTLQQGRILWWLFWGIVAWHATRKEGV
jgi:O-antigen ligase